MGFFSRKYKFTDKKISRGGILSSLFALGAIAFFCNGVYISYMADGNGSETVGIMGLYTLLLSVVGFVVGVKSFKKDNVFLGFPWFGVVLNAIIGIFMMCVIFIGI